MTEEFDQDIAQLDQEISGIETQQTEFMNRKNVLMTQREEVLTRKLKSLSDADIMSDENVLRYVLKQSFYSDAAFNRIQKLCAIFLKELKMDELDWREKYVGQSLPSLTIMLKKNQSVIAVRDAIETWTLDWALGRSDFVFSILDEDCAHNGAYYLRYELSGYAEIYMNNLYNVRTSGTLEECLHYIAKNLYWES